MKENTDSEGFVCVSDVVPEIILDIRYYSTYNFLGERVDGYEEPVALLTAEAAEALKKASGMAISKGYRLKLFDAYRPQCAVDHFARWADKHKDTIMKGYFYPEVDKRKLFELGFVAEKSGHSRGSTVDLTLFSMETQKDIDMGGTFDYFGDLSWSEYVKDITEEQIANRKLLRDIMISCGFRPLDEEWWHITLENEPYPDTYFSFPVNSAQVRKKQTFAEKLENDMEFRFRFFDVVAKTCENNRNCLEETLRKVILETVQEMEKFSEREKISFDETKLNDAINHLEKEVNKTLISLLK